MTTIGIFCWSKCIELSMSNCAPRTIRRTPGIFTGTRSRLTTFRAGTFYRLRRLQVRHGLRFGVIGLNSCQTRASACCQSSILSQSDRQKCLGMRRPVPPRDSFAVEQAGFSARKPRHGHCYPMRHGKDTDTRKNGSCLSLRLRPRGGGETPSIHSPGSREATRLAFLLYWVWFAGGRLAPAPSPIFTTGEFPKAKSDQKSCWRIASGRRQNSPP